MESSMSTTLRISTILVTLSALALPGCAAQIDDTPDDGETADDRGAAGSAEESVGTAAQAIVNGQVVRIRAAHSLKCVDVAGSSTADGASLIQWDCNAQPNQQFQAWRQPDGSWELSAIHSDKCVDVEGASTTNGARLLQYGCDHGANQQFWISYSAGSYFLQAKHSGKYVEVRGYSLDSGAIVDQWDYNGGLLNQRFYLE